MEITESIIKLCCDFKDRKIDIEELQSRLQTLRIDECSKEIYQVLHEVDNELEDIKYCKLKENFYQYGVKVADSLIERIKDL